MGRAHQRHGAWRARFRSGGRAPRPHRESGLTAYVCPRPGRRRQVRDENNELYYRAPRNITRDARDVKDRVVVTTETISLCLTHLNARSAPRSGNPDVIDRVYVEHFDVDDVKKGNRRRSGSLVTGVGYAPAPRSPFPARAIEARPSDLVIASRARYRANFLKNLMQGNIDRESLNEEERLMLDGVELASANDETVKMVRRRGPARVRSRPQDNAIG